MDRIGLLNALIRICGYRDYLEIGVRKGEAFMQIEAARRTGVDPELTYMKQKLEPRLKGLGKRLIGRDAWVFESDDFRLFEMTSDSFFERYDEQFDLVFIDGLHQFDQVLLDYRNAQRVLRDGGCVVFHDCNPLTATAAQRDREQGNVLWNGDTWKAVYYLRQQGHEVRTYAFDHGCGLAFKHEAPKEYPEADIQALLELSFDALERDRPAAIGLRDWDEDDLRRELDSSPR